jgi:hypothetical protein
MAEDTLQHSQPREGSTARGWAERAKSARKAMEETSNEELKRLLEKLAKASEAMSHKPRS